MHHRIIVCVLSGLAAALGLITPAKASLTINLQFANGSTTRTLTSGDVGTSIPISVYATITTAIPVTPNYEGSGANHDGMEYAYYDVLSSLTAGNSAVDGQLTSAILDAGAGFNALGASVTGTLEDANSDGVTDLGPATSSSFYAGTSSQMAALAKPSTTVTPTWEDKAGVGSPQIVISADRLSVSFLLETLYFTVTSLSAQQTTFQPVIPTLPNPYSSANWYEDIPTEPAAFMPIPVAYYRTSGDTAGTSVTFLAPATVPEPTFVSLMSLGSLCLLARRRRTTQ